MVRADVLCQLAELILAVERPHPVRVAIDGVDGAGKTTLADELHDVLEDSGRQIIRASIDGFHIPRGVRHRHGSRSAQGYYEDSFNYPVMIESLLTPLGPNGDLSYIAARFDYRTDVEVSLEVQTAQPDSILIFDGVFLQRSELEGCWDFTVFVAADIDVTSERACLRDKDSFGSFEEVMAMYKDRYIPGQKIYFEREKPFDKADVILFNDDLQNPRLVVQRG